MTQPRSQDERTWARSTQDDPLAPPAPANQWTPHDGGIEPAPPARNAAAAALRRLAAAARRALGRR